jgi:hypothetical protein
MILPHLKYFVKELVGFAKHHVRWANILMKNAYGIILERQEPNLGY